MLFVVAAIFCYDIWFYSSHVLLHKYLYVYHAEHHKYIVPTFRDTYKGHLFEGPFQSLGVFVPCLLHSYTVVEIIVVVLFLNARGMMRHDQRFSFITGDHHLMHHLHPKYNYGEKWIDYLLGTNLVTVEKIT
jgi:sterol desaturase/sphingolipid hydroxylase (fatty acid hydroxylase superfamily)